MKWQLVRNGLVAIVALLVATTMILLASDNDQKAAALWIGIGKGLWNIAIFIGDLF
ncbi:MAG TPA: hypothetical protein VLG40_03965 [Candidatus Saccharimonas sp.]|nr:hypothetical protein [Candidatus Saccharimonas sp.]